MPIHKLASDKEHIKGAGIMFITPDDEALFLLRSPDANHPNEWDLPGGKAEDDETPEETAKRETGEEVGSHPYGELEKLADTASEDDSGTNVDFITYRMFIRHKFKPKLDAEEHTSFVWRKLDNTPEPLHPGVRAVVDSARGVKVAKDKAIEVVDSLAFDRASIRTMDKDGRMHVALTPISKAMVCGYLGKEIPDPDNKLKLDPTRIYWLLRDPDELEKSVSTWNGLQLLNEHVPVDASDHKPELIIGSTGTDAVFNSPYLMQSLAIWTEDAIKGVEDKTEHEISSCYHYDADMTPGVYEGVHHDGVMRNIVGNHVILCSKGRAGPDVRVAGDQLCVTLNGAMKMSKSLSKKAYVVRGALLAVAPRMLAADSQIDLNSILSGVKRKNWLDRKPGIVAAIKPHLAKDADIADIVQLLDKLDSEQPDNDDLGQDEPDEKVTGILDMLRGKISDEDLAQIEAMLNSKPVAAQEVAAKDEPTKTANTEAKPEPKAEPNRGEPGNGFEDLMDKKAMDKAIKLACDAAAKDAEHKTIARMRAISEAEEFVKPYVGKLVAKDSAEAVYKAALDVMKINVKDVHPSAYQAILAAQPKPGGNRKESFAQDSSPGSLSADVLAMFPDAARLG